eukprot:4017879-Alexandrium_andersonii.AAC.1
MPSPAWFGRRPTATLVRTVRSTVRRPAHWQRSASRAAMASLAGASCARMRITRCPGAAVRPT